MELEAYPDAGFCGSLCGFPDPGSQSRKLLRRAFLIGFSTRPDADHRRFQRFGGSKNGGEILPLIGMKIRTVGEYRKPRFSAKSGSFFRCGKIPGGNVDVAAPLDAGEVCFFRNRNDFLHGFFPEGHRGHTSFHKSAPFLFQRGLFCTLIISRKALFVSAFFAESYAFFAFKETNLKKQANFTYDLQTNADSFSSIYFIIKIRKEKGKFLGKNRIIVTNGGNGNVSLQNPR